MKESDKNLLIKDLCSRIPYDTVVYVNGNGDVYLLHTGLLSDEEKKMAEVISAIRLGRALRKSADNIEQRKKIFESWRRIATE